MFQSFLGYKHPVLKESPIETCECIEGFHSGKNIAVRKELVGADTLEITFSVILSVTIV